MHVLTVPGGPGWPTGPGCPGGPGWPAGPLLPVPLGPPGQHQTRV